MTIPKYDEMYRAFLDCLTDGQPHKSKEVKDTIAEVFHLSDEERAVLLPSGSGPGFGGPGCFEKNLSQEGRLD